FADRKACPGHSGNIACEIEPGPKRTAPRVAPRVATAVANTDRDSGVLEQSGGVNELCPGDGHAGTLQLRNQSLQPRRHQRHRIVVKKYQNFTLRASGSE